VTGQKELSHPLVFESRVECRPFKFRPGKFYQSCYGSNSY